MSMSSRGLGGSPRIIRNISSQEIDQLSDDVSAFEEKVSTTNSEAEIYTANLADLEEDIEQTLQGGQLDAIAALLLDFQQARTTLDTLKGGRVQLVNQGTFFSQRIQSLLRIPQLDEEMRSQLQGLATRVTKAKDLL